MAARMTMGLPRASRTRTRLTSFSARMELSLRHLDARGMSLCG
jgi:hypothetical protein